MLLVKIYSSASDQILNFSYLAAFFRRYFLFVYII